MNPVLLRRGRLLPLIVLEKPLVKRMHSRGNNLSDEIKHVRLIQTGVTRGILSIRDWA